MAYSANPEVTKTLHFCQTKSRGVARGGEAEHLRNLADQLTLFKPGEQIMPFTLLPAPPDSKSYLHLCT